MSVETLDFLIKLCVIAFSASISIGIATGCFRSKFACAFERAMMSVTGFALGACLVLCLIKLGSFL